MNRKYLFLIILFFIFLYTAGAESKKIRFIGTAGVIVQNEIIDELGFSGGLGIHLAYPVSQKTNIINIELSIANWYNAFPFENDFIHLLRFGFGIRVFLNTLKFIRPYFTHNINSHIVWIKNREGYAPTFGILLGLGIDIPIKYSEDTKMENSSIFFDITYNSFYISYFEIAEKSMKFIMFSCGFSWNLS